MTGLPVGGIRLETGIHLGIEIGSKIGHVLRGQRHRIRHHDGVVALRFFEILQLIGDVIGPQSSQTGPLGIDAVAVRAVAGLANDGFCGAGFRVPGGTAHGARHGAGNCCCKYPKPLHDRLEPHSKVNSRPA